MAKHHLRVEAYGTVDEANAILGLCRLQLNENMDDVLGRIQNDLFDCGADLATPLMENLNTPCACQKPK